MIVNLVIIHEACTASVLYFGTACPSTLESHIRELEKCLIPSFTVYCVKCARISVLATNSAQSTHLVCLHNELKNELNDLLSPNK
jgi:hypothetical protein